MSDVPARKLERADHEAVGGHGHTIPRDLDDRRVSESDNTLGVLTGFRPWDAFGVTGEDETVVLAGTQTQGRGSRGRSWFSPPGGLYLSAIFRPRLEPGAALGLTLAAGVASAEAVMACGPAEVKLKWPNDLRLADRKLGGVLVETAAVPGRLRHAVVGIGINVNIAPEAFPPELQASAISLLEHLGRPVDLRVLVREVLERLDACCQALERGETAQVVERWRALDALAGQRVSVTSPQGRLEGECLGIDEGGALLVRDGTGQVQRVASRSTVEIEAAP